MSLFDTERPEMTFRGHFATMDIFVNTGVVVRDDSMQTTARHKYGERRIALNVRVKMAEKGFRNAASLHRALIAMGCDISHRQLLRIIDNTGDSLSKDVLDAMLNLFDCSPAELFTEVRPGQAMPGQEE